MQRIEAEKKPKSSNEWKTKFNAELSVLLQGDGAQTTTSLSRLFITAHEVSEYSNGFISDLSHFLEASTTYLHTTYMSAVKHLIKSANSLQHRSTNKNIKLRLGEIINTLTTIEDHFNRAFNPFRAFGYAVAIGVPTGLAAVIVLQLVPLLRNRTGVSQEEIQRLGTQSAQYAEQILGGQSTQGVDQQEIANQIAQELAASGTPTSSATPELLATQTAINTETPTATSTQTTPEATRTPNRLPTETKAPTGTPRASETPVVNIQADPSRPNIFQLSVPLESDGFTEPQGSYFLRPQFRNAGLAYYFRELLTGSWLAFSQQENANVDNSLFYEILVGEWTPPHLVTEENRGLGLIADDLSMLYDPSELDLASKNTVSATPSELYAFRATLSEGVGHIAPAIGELENVYSLFIGNPENNETWNAFIRRIVEKSIDQYDVKTQDGRIVDITARKTCRLFEQPESIQTLNDVFTTTGTEFSYNQDYSLENPVRWNETEGGVAGEMIVVIDQKGFKKEVETLEAALGIKLSEDQKVNVLTEKFLRVVWIENQSRLLNVPSVYTTEYAANPNSGFVQLDSAELLPCGVEATPTLIPTRTPTYFVTRTPEDTDVPTETPKPSETPRPTDTPKSTPTGIPTNPPEPTRSAVPSNTPWVEPTEPKETSTPIPKRMAEMLKKVVLGVSSFFGGNK